MTDSRSSSHDKALFRISLAINSEIDLPEILSLVVENTRDLAGCSDAGLVLWNSRLRQFEEGASTSSFGRSVAQRVRRSGGASRWIIDHGQPLVVPDTTDDPFSVNRMIPEGGVKAYIGVPIQHREERLGVLYALYGDVQNFAGDEQQIVSEMANMAAIAIYNARLVSSLRDLNDFKDGMIQLAAHDLRSPLALAMGYFEILVDSLENPGPEQLAWAAITRRSLERIEDLATGILDYGRLSNDGELNRFPCDFNAIGRLVKEDFEQIAGQRGQQLSFNPAPHPPVMLGDELLLREALTNLVSNALKYTPDGGAITIETAQDDVKIVVSVRDTGPGIDRAEQERLFQPFTRLNNAAKQEGSGLGLSLVRMIVERHGGYVCVESELGRGSTFQIHLPLAEGSSLPRPQASELG